MTKKDVLELKRRLKKNECTFSRLCGCYVNADKEIVLNMNETFLNLEEEEYYKYLEIAKKTLSGTLGNNLLELEFPLEETQSGGKQQFLMGLRESKLKNDALLETFYRQIIDNYDYAGNYLILVFNDAYDVMTKTSDNNKLDESEEVYEYLLVSICPVSLSKPGLGYLKTENRIGPRIRDWVVGVPETGFIFPAFTDRSTDLHATLFYTKNAKEPHKELMEGGLGCPAKTTATEQKNTFHAILHNVISDEEKRDKVIMDIQESLTQIVEDQDESNEEPVLLTNDSIQEILVDSGLPEEVTKKIETAYEENFGDTPPVVDHLIDSKILAASAQKKKEQALFQQVQTLQEKLEETTTQAAALVEADPVISQISSDEFTSDEMLEETNEEGESTSPLYDVILRVKPQKMDQIKSEVIDGKKCIIIPMDENEHANVNGVTTLL
ncbi:hypothetical protein lbkm_2338 [Lachnospiraceae bacterium KM106-2]|nr:hypothetical protein lbkm_2338 [Lachnospiraceae bacterium KM106-2]